MASDPIRRVVENMFTLRRLENGLDRESRELLRALFNDIAAQIARIDPTGPSRQTFRRQRLDRLLRELQELIGGELEAWRKMIRQELAEIGAQQAVWARGTLVDSLGGGGAMAAAGVQLSAPTGVGVNFFKAILDADPFRGETLEQWAGRQEAKTVRDVRRQIQLGMTENETIDQIVRRVRGRSVGGGRYAGGVLETTTREAEAIVRTSVTHIADAAHFETYSREPDITTQFEYVATLDSRTTIICASLDGERFGYDDPNARRPPQHFNCRSTIVPVIDFEELGIDRPEATRAAEGGPVSANTDYQQWLRDQPASVQNEVLGPARAKLFREGKVTLDQMVRRDNSVLTVEQLKERAT